LSLMTLSFFSGPAITLSMASPTSSLLTLSKSFLAASIAASFKRLAKSAPVNPGVLLAMLSSVNPLEVSYSSHELPILIVCP